MNCILNALISTLVLFPTYAAAENISWLGLTILEDHLNGRNELHIPMTQLIDEEVKGEICQVGSYSFKLPNHLSDSQKSLEASGLMPVQEGKGLIFTTTQSGTLIKVSELSVWSGDVILAQSEKGVICHPTNLTHLALRRNGKSIFINISKN